MSREKLTRSEQREAAREKARNLREQHKKGEKRKKLAVQLGVGIGILAVLGTIGFALVSGANKESAVPTNLTVNNGIKIGTNLEAFTADYTPAPGAAGTSVPNIQIYLDYQCPYCQAFELPNASQIESWVTKGTATIEIHPISFLDGRGTPNQYSSRAANAAVCLAQYSPNNFFKFNALLFANQPAEGTPGPENEELKARVKEVGATNVDLINKCIDNKTYSAWISDITTKVLNEPIPGTKIQVDSTPFVLVNGERFVTDNVKDFYNPARFAQFVQSKTQ